MEEDEEERLGADGGGGASPPADAVDGAEGTTATLLAFRGSAATLGFVPAPLTRSVLVFVEEEVIRARPAGRELPVVVVVVVEPADFAAIEAAAAPCAIGLKPVLPVPPPVELAKFAIPSCEPAFGVGSVVGRASVRDADRDDEDVLVEPLTVRVCDLTAAAAGSAAERVLLRRGGGPIPSDGGAAEVELELAWWWCDDDEEDDDACGAG